MSFPAFAAAHGLILTFPNCDGRWHRVSTEDKPRKKNGAYVFDGVSGAVRNWATMDDFALYRDERSQSTVDPSAMRERIRLAQKETEARHAAAAKKAGQMVAMATVMTPAPPKKYGPKFGVPPHPYLLKKGLGDEPYLALEGKILVPMRVGKNLVNVQSIDEEGHKLFLSGRAKGAILRIGPTRARMCWLVEGYATALTVRLACRAAHFDAAVVCCFSAGNLAYVADEIGSHVFADNDESNAGSKSAESTGLPWVMAPKVGMDANDLMLSDGLAAVVKLIRKGVA